VKKIVSLFVRDPTDAGEDAPVGSSVERRDGVDVSGGPDGWERVKCPRGGCPGHGYIRRW
jgi:hypothetical protein